MITSAPERITSRTFRVTPSTPSQSPLGIPGYSMPHGPTPPLGIHASACPPVIESIATLICIRGPTSVPSSTAALSPASAPEASRTDVIPSASVSRRFSAIRKNGSLNGSFMTRTRPCPRGATPRWTWQSNRPGSSVLPAQSTPSSPSRSAPTAAIRPSAIATSPSATGAPEPSKTLPPWNTVVVIRLTPPHAAPTLRATLPAGDRRGPATDRRGPRPGAQGPRRSPTRCSIPLEDECEEHDGLTPGSHAAAKQAVLDWGFNAHQPRGGRRWPGLRPVPGRC